MPRKKEVAKRQKRERNPEALGISGFTLGIVSLVLLLFSPALGIITSIVGFLFCLFQQKRKKTKMARAGMIINIVSFGVNVAWWVIYAFVIYPYIQQSISSISSTVP